MKKRALIYFLISVIVLSISIVVFAWLDKERLTRIVSYFGSIASFIGIVITLIEVYHAERIARTTKEAVKDKLNSMFRDEVLSTIVKATDDCVSILDSLPKDDFGYIIKRCRNLQDSLILIGGTQNSWINDKERKHLKELSVRVKLDIQTIVRSQEGKFSLNKAFLLKNFEELRTCMKQLEQSIKTTEQKA